MTSTSPQLKTMTDSELAEYDKGGWWQPATNAQLNAMTPAELAEEAWWSAAQSDPLRWSRTAAYPVLFINYGVRALLGRVLRADGGVLRDSWRGFAVPPSRVALAIKRLRSIRGLSTRGRTVIDVLADRLKFCRRVGVAFVEDGPDRWYRNNRNKIVQHEIFHLFQFRHQARKGSAAKALIKHPATVRALPHLRKHGYDVGMASVVVSEMAAYIFSRDYAALGLRRSEAAEWFSAYCQQHRLPRTIGTGKHHVNTRHPTG